MTGLELVRQYFPEADEELADYILWNKTSYPNFLSHGMISLRAQLRKYKKARLQGKDICGFCGNIVKGKVDPCNKCKTDEN